MRNSNAEVLFALKDDRTKDVIHVTADNFYRGHCLPVPADSLHEIVVTVSSDRNDPLAKANDSSVRLWLI